jgi:hypothetical protein
MKSYTESSLLHVGVTDSHCNVYNFDQSSRRIDKPSVWAESVSVSLPSSLSDKEWDVALETFFASEKKSPFFSLCFVLFISIFDSLLFCRANHDYHYLDNNCFSFAIRFLNQVVSVCILPLPLPFVDFPYSVALVAQINFNGEKHDKNTFASNLIGSVSFLL